MKAPAWVLGGRHWRFDVPTKPPVSSTNDSVFRSPASGKATTAILSKTRSCCGARSWRSLDMAQFRSGAVPILKRLGPCATFDGTPAHHMQPLTPTQRSGPTQKEAEHE